LRKVRKISFKLRVKKKRIAKKIERKAGRVLKIKRFLLRRIMHNNQ